MPSVPAFLVASPSLTCPFFKHGVVLLVDHGLGGSFGFALHQPSPIVAADIAEELEFEPTTALKIARGGPVSEDTGWLVFDPSAFSTQLPAQDWLRLGPRLAMTSSVAVLRLLAPQVTKENARFFLGYSGWSEGQLEEEMNQGSWLPCDVATGLLFGEAPDSIWAAALGQMGISPGQISTRQVPLA